MAIAEKDKIDKSNYPRLSKVKTPTVLQMEMAECGAAALGIILAHYGRHEPLEKLRVACAVSRDGSNALNILRAAESYGLNCEGFQSTPAELHEAKVPFIAHWKGNHFVVVEGFDSKYAFINDPARGRIRISHATFNRDFSQVLLMVEPNENFEKKGSPPSPIPILKERIKRIKSPLAFLIAIGFCAVIAGLGVAGYTKVLMDEILGKQHLSWEGWFLALVVFVLGLQVFLQWIQSFYLYRLEMKLNIRFASEFFWHLLRLPAVYYAQRYGGEVSSRMGYNQSITKVITQRLTPLVVQLAMGAFYGFVIIQYNFWIAGIGIAFALLDVGLTVFVNSFRTEKLALQANDVAKSYGFGLSLLQNVESIKATGQESDYFSRWAGYQTNAINAEQDLGRFNAKVGIIPEILHQMSQLFLLGLGAYFVMEGELSIGLLFALQSLMTAFMSPLSSLVGLGETFANMKVEVLRLNDVLRNPIDPSLEKTENAVDKSKLEGALEARDLNFSYSVGDEKAIKNFSFVLEPGQHLALVGASGCGKSTVARLLTGLYQPHSGEILLDGKPQSAWSRGSLTRSLASVDQEIFLFEGSIRDNLTLWDPSRSYEDILKAAEDACILDEILALEGGFDAKLTENGRNLSGGQRQRLEIARALCSNPRILVLDEATSALDAATEEKILRNLRRRGCTCVVVAHRLSTVRDCDEILLVHQGQIIQRGVHEDLSRVEGPYRALLKEGGQ